MKKAYVDIPDGQVHYRTEGAGQTVLLLHQTAFDSDEYSDVIPLLSPHCRAIAMDSMGYGMSDLPSKPFLIPDYARSVSDFIKALGVNKVILAGHHTGAAIAVEVAATFPELVEQLVLSGAPYYAPGVREARLRDNRYQPMKIVEDGAYIMEAWNKLRKFMPAAGPAGWHRFITASLLAGPRGEDGHHAVFLYDIEPRLSLINCPTLLISGTRDTFTDRVQATQQKVHGSKVRMIEGGGPMVAVEQPAQFASAILEFLSSKPAANN